MEPVSESQCAAERAAIAKGDNMRKSDNQLFGHPGNIGLSLFR
jgi:hypothetical protein